MGAWNDFYLGLWWVMKDFVCTKKIASYFGKLENNELSTVNIHICIEINNLGNSHGMRNIWDIIWKEELRIK